MLSLPPPIDMDNPKDMITEFVRSSPSSIIQFLVDAYPEAVGIPNENGKLPLHVAAEHGMPFVHVLARAEPRALTTRCLETDMYPFQLAAVSLVEPPTSDFFLANQE